MTARLVVLLLCLLAHVASADAPKGYKCGPGGYRVKDTCKCPDEKQPARDADNKAICEPKPEPKPEACMGDRKGKHAIKIEGNPVGATIYLGSKDCPAVGRTPWTGKLAAGPVTVIVDHQGYEPETKLVTVTPKSKTSVFMILQRTNAGSVEVKADADPNVVGVAVTIDGQPQGTVPVTIKKVKSGRHLVEIAKPGFDPFQQWIEVQDGQTTLLMPVLRPIVAAKGRMVIDADVPQAEVFVNGERKGTTPLALDNLPLGSYDVIVKKAPSKDWQRTIALGPGTTLVRAELAPTMPKVPTHAELEIIADAPGAEVWVDGAAVG
nr:PEGA domain-containing protein [Deltaproteobacteria bacterium]